MSAAAHRLAKPATAFAILLIAAAFTWVALVQPLLAWHAENEAAIGDARAQIARLRGVVMLGSNSGGSMPAGRLEELRADFLAGPNDAIIAADLQARLRAIIVKHNCELTKAHALPSKSVKDQALVGVRLNIRGHMRHVHEVLHAIETATPFLFVERAQLKLWEFAGAALQPNEDAAAQMVAELDIFGAQWPNESSLREEQ